MKRLLALCMALNWLTGCTNEYSPTQITCADWVRYRREWYDNQRVLYDICREEVRAGRPPCAVIEYGKCRVQVMPDKEVLG